jgi:hypothetical protein
LMIRVIFGAAGSSFFADITLWVTALGCPNQMDSVFKIYFLIWNEFIE